jgi:hypothetical protein
VNAGTILSGTGHAALLLWVVLGDWLFSAQNIPPIPVMTVETISESDFEKLQETAAAPAAVAEVAAGVTPEPRPESPAPEPEPPVPEPEPEPPAPTDPPPAPEPAILPAPVREPEPEPLPEPDPEPVPEPVEPDAVVEVVPDPEPVTEAPVSETPQPEFVLPSVAPVLPDVRPKPKPAPVIAPDPVDAPDEPAEPAVEAQPEVTEIPDPEPPPPEPEVEPATQQDTGETTLTEANQDDTPSTIAPTSSARPQRRPEAPIEPAIEEQAPATETAAETAPEEPAPEEPAATDTAAEDALAAALAEAVAAEDAPAPAGPPMTVGEKEGLRVAVEACWNVGALSTEALGTAIKVFVDVAPDGRPITGSISLEGFSGGSEAAANQAFEAARRAIIRCGAEGFPLPPEKYDEWKELELNFDASGMRMR